jgi:hypothetical protein
MDHRASSPSGGVGGGGSQVLGMTSGPTIRQQLDALAMVSGSSARWERAAAAAGVIRGSSGRRQRAAQRPWRASERAGRQASRSSSS